MSRRIRKQDASCAQLTSAGLEPHAHRWKKVPSVQVVMVSKGMRSTSEKNDAATLFNVPLEMTGYIINSILIQLVTF